ncbi:MAG: beta-propeller fold lactonase family protein [Pseudomonadota bacterium]
MQHRVVFVVLSLGLAGCLRDAAPPWLGACGVYPDGVYEYGQIGIGTCLASPGDVRFIERDGGTFLAVSNANAFRDFDGGSVALIDWSSLDFSQPRNLTGDLAIGAVTLPHFPGAIAEVPERDLLAVPVRYSEGANTRAHDDDLHFIDISDPTSPVAAAVGEAGASTLTVQADPFSAVFQPESGYLFVGNRTAHTVSVIDALASPVALVDAEERADIDGARFFDEDRSGSAVTFSALEISDRTILIDEDWDLSYVEGTWQAWLPDGVGLARYVSGGDGAWSASRYGTELDPAGSEGVIGAIADPYFYDSSSLGPRMLFADDDGSLRGATPGDFLADWLFDADPLLEGRADSWDATLGGPFALQDAGVTVLFYDGTSAEGVSAIGAAASVSGYSDFYRLGVGPLLAAGGEHDALSQRHPWVYWDPSAQLWTMLYSAWDGARWSIGRAISAELDEGWLAEPDPVFSLAGIDCAVPRITATPRGFTLLYDRREEGGDWEIGQAESFDGQAWVELGVIADLPAIPAEACCPPGLALDLQVEDSFRIEGERTGPTILHARAGVTLDSGDYGFRLRIVAGEQLELDALGGASVDGLGVASVAPELGLAYLRAVDAQGRGSIGVASWDGASLAAEPAPILEAGTAGSFDEDGVSSPVVFQDSRGTWVMLYAGTSGGVARLGRATSTDGRLWEKDPTSPVMDDGPEWDSYGIWPGSVEPLEEGGYRLWYTGSNGERTRIGIAESADGEAFAQAREDGGWQFGGGSPGDWDDTSVADPWLLVFGDARHLWYTGYDGDERRIGHAIAEDGSLDFSRDEDAEGDPISLLEGELGLFDYGGVQRPVALHDERGWVLFYEGIDLGVFRPGLAVGTGPTVLYKAPRGPTAGDRLTFHTQAGHGGVDPIDLDGTVDGFATVGTGLAAMHLDEARGLLFVASKLVSYLQVLDVRDDSTSGFDDANYLGVEAILPVEVASGGAGFRGLAESADGRWLYALNDSPESVMVFDLSRVEDDAWGDVVYDTMVGWLPTPRGYERDQGAATVASAGSGGVVLMPDGQTLLVTNFNDNSLGVYDLRMGAYGQLVGEVTLLGENPYAVAVSPDGKLAVVACYEGDLDGTAVNSTLAVVDVDPLSDTWLEVLTWIANL